MTSFVVAFLRLSQKVYLPWKFAKYSGGLLGEVVVRVMAVEVMDWALEVH